MIRYHDKNGKMTPWLSEPPTEKELKRLTIDQLLILAKRQKGFKTQLVNSLVKSICGK